MTWSIFLSEKARERLDNLEDSLKNRILSKLKEIKENTEKGVDPDHYFKWINSYSVHRLRVGDYRIFTDIDKNDKEIRVLTILPRYKAYRGWG